MGYAKNVIERNGKKKMIKIEKVEVFGWESAIRGMRNPMNSWDKSDSGIGCEDESCLCEECQHSQRRFPGDCAGHFIIGPNDLKLMKNLVKAGNDHAKFMRMINVTMDITAPLYWFKEFDTYKVGTTANSCSTMHKIHAKKFTLDDFSHEHLFDGINKFGSNDFLERYENSTTCLEYVIGVLNYYRNKFIETKDKRYWWQMIQLLPSSYNQKRTIQLNYAVLKNMYHSRRNHKLDEWRNFCTWIESLPYSELITGGKDE